MQISARQANGRIEIHVSDDGAGFSEDFAAHAFERFRRGTEAHSGDGAGLGLAIVDAVARAHHGSTGADVWMSLPT